MFMLLEMETKMCVTWLTLCICLLFYLFLFSACPKRYVLISILIVKYIFSSFGWGLLGSSQLPPSSVSCEHYSQHWDLTSNWFAEAENFPGGLQCSCMTTVFQSESHTMSIISGPTFFILLMFMPMCNWHLEQRLEVINLARKLDFTHFLF